MNEKEQHAGGHHRAHEGSFTSLSVRDLLDARDAYHFHFASIDNVLGTAIGLYRMHPADPAAVSASPADAAAYGKAPPRTFQNTVVRPWSWPCVMVMVRDWHLPGHFAHGLDQVVPRRLYLPDGRVVPTCVIAAPPDTSPPPAIDHLSPAAHTLGGGFPCVTDVQGSEHVGTIGALVRRQGLVYALTNSHVAGEPGTPVDALIGGDRVAIGTTDETHLSRLPFDQAYPGWSVQHCYVAIDAGLIRIDDLNSWTGQAYGIGEIGPLVDMSIARLDLSIVGTPVRSFGAASGVSEGEVYGLFYRFRSVGGADCVADLLIGPRTEDPDRERRLEKDASAPQPKTLAAPGDSGALVFVDPPSAEEKPDEPRRGVGVTPRKLRPLAMQWGGVRLKAGPDGSPASQLALATFLSTVLRELDLDLYNDWNTGYSEYWGKHGHFKVGYKFAELLKTPRLAELMLANRQRIGFSDQDLEAGGSFTFGRGKFVPLADVPDLRLRNMYGSTEQGSHFADLDLEPAGKGTDLLTLCRTDPATNLSASVWMSYYAKFKGHKPQVKPGCLPFRVRQLYEAMVGALTGPNPDLLSFVTAAGIMAHYVADCGMCLHLSYLHHGDPSPVENGQMDEKTFMASPAAKIHGILEQDMLMRHMATVNAKVNAQLASYKTGATVSDGAGALQRVFTLMSDVFTTLPPHKVVCQTDDPSLQPKPRAELLFKKVGAKTLKCLGLSCIAMAELVESAWAQAGGDVLLGSAPVPMFTEQQVTDTYSKKTFVPPQNLKGYIAMGY